ncbi:MAG: hypothetical protein AAB641_00050 [Patescibacteria group bacterium]
MSFERPSPEEMGIKPETSTADVPEQKSIEDKAREAAHDRLRASGEKSRADLFTRKIDALSDEIGKMEAQQPVLEAAGTDVGPESDFARNLERKRAELEDLQQDKAEAERQLSGFNESGIAKSDSEVVEKMHMEANWDNTQVAIREAITGVKGYVESGRTIEKLFNWAQRAESLDRFNTILENAFDSKVRESLMTPKVQDVLKSYYENREQNPKSGSK